MNFVHYFHSHLTDVQYEGRIPYPELSVQRPVGRAGARSRKITILGGRTIIAGTKAS